MLTISFRTRLFATYPDTNGTLLLVFSLKGRPTFRVRHIMQRELSNDRRVVAPMESSVGLATKPFGRPAIPKRKLGLRSKERIDTSKVLE